MIEKLSTLADSFPETEVEYEDLLALQYAPDARGEGGVVDCIGIIIEVFRRAGLGLPDPKSSAVGVLGFADLFERVSNPDRLFDLINVRRESNHVMIVVRHGVALSSRAMVGVYTQRVNHILRLGGVECWRVKDAALP